MILPRISYFLRVIRKWTQTGRGTVCQSIVWILLTNPKCHIIVSKYTLSYICPSVPCSTSLSVHTTATFLPGQREFVPLLLAQGSRNRVSAKYLETVWVIVNWSPEQELNKGEGHGESPFRVNFWWSHRAWVRGSTEGSAGLAFKIKLKYWLYISRDRSTNTMDRKLIPVQNKDVKTLNRGYQIQSSRAPAEPGFLSYQVGVAFTWNVWPSSTGFGQICLKGSCV